MIRFSEQCLVKKKGSKQLVEDPAFGRVTLWKTVQVESSSDSM